MLKTIILNLKTPDECMRQKSIVEELIKQGNIQILPSALFPNEIHITYIHNSNISDYNIVSTKSGKSFIFNN